MIGPHQPSILDALVRRALDGPPDRVAVQDGERVVTFGALAGRVGRLSAIPVCAGRPDRRAIGPKGRTA